MSEEGQEPLDEEASRTAEVSPSVQSVTSRIDALLPGLKAGRPESYNQLHSLIADRLFRGAYRLLGDRQEAEDAVQEAFLELVRAGCPPEAGRSLEAWLHTSIRFTCADQFRLRQRRPASPRADVPDQKDEDEYWLGYDPALEEALAELTPMQRLIIQLKHVEGMDGNSIAEITGATRGAVYAAAARAERRLGRLLVNNGRTGGRRSGGGWR
ncbi:MAG: RNA polymerase sigma factor [Acidimicrobiales bacterium]